MVISGGLLGFLLIEECSFQHARNALRFRVIESGAMLTSSTAEVLFVDGSRRSLLRFRSDGDRCSPRGGFVEEVDVVYCAAV